MRRQQVISVQDSREPELADRHMAVLLLLQLANTVAKTDGKSTQRGYTRPDVSSPISMGPTSRYPGT